MKSQWLLTTLSGVSVWLGTSALMADQPPSTAVPPQRQATPAGEQATPPAQQDLDVSGKARTNEHATGHTHGITCRASDLIGMSVKNKKGEELGSLQDLVLDPKTGTIRYAALGRGGLLGVGQKLVAVPWTAFECPVKEREERAFRPGQQPQTEPQTGVAFEDQFQLILDIDAKTLDQHPGFKKDSWPQSGDESLMNKGTQRAEERLPAQQSDIQQGEPATRPGSQPFEQPRDN